MDTLVTTEWLSEHLSDPDLLVLDCSVHTEQNEQGIRNLSGRQAYDAGHIPSAGFADLKNELCDLTSPIEFALPTPEVFCREMGRLGVGDSSKVVLYDNSFSAWAARVWWMLRWIGFDQAAILDGGLGAWKAEGRPLSKEPASYPARQLTLKLRPQVVADRDEVLNAIDDGAVCLIDTLPAEFYRGEATIYARPGHIPSATNSSALELLDETGRYRPLEELASLHPKDKIARTITYCGGGIAASSSAFILTRLGFKDVAVYTASLQEWAADSNNPLVTGSAP
jgi:thiosulfate/3-mercaptopyruvate sulfurtransferase